MTNESQRVAAFQWAQERFAEWGVDVQAALQKVSRLSVSIHCWQADDVAGFEANDVELGGGLAVTGRFPGRARNAEQVRQDFEWALHCLPGRHRLNLHANYAETNGARVERNELSVEHFQGWIDWARSRGLGLDFNSTYFAHPLADEGLTLTHPIESTRRFWIEHGVACRKIGAALGRALDSPCIHNVWIPDGFKDLPVDRQRPRDRLTDSLDQIFAEAFSEEHLLDAVESKLFGIGSESYVAGSHEFYLGYAISRRKWLCLDSGHFHPTESIADKLSSVSPWVPGILLHVSRPVRWDSDHVVTLSDELRAIADETTHIQEAGRPIRIGLDFFDASINRVAAWVIGTRNLLKALLMAHLQPWPKLRAAEQAGDYTHRLAWQEELKTMPYGAVWDYLCLQSGVPVGAEWLDELAGYERDVQLKRDARSA